MVPSIWIASFVLTTAVVLFAVERRWPGRRWPVVRGWWPRAIALNAVQGACVYLAGATWDPWLLGVQPWSATGLPTVAGALVGYAVITFVYYWWHRWRHERPGLWRWLHQVHHSPQRIEIPTTFYKHPLEVVCNGILSSVLLYGVVGLAPDAATLAVLLTGLAELFYHWNVSTPRWLGFLIQRPESHCVHHQAGVHAYNYADLPLWDMLFGTFHNPHRFDAACGFGPGGEARLAAMLRGIDVTPDLRAEPAG